MADILDLEARRGEALPLLANTTATLLPLLVKIPRLRRVAEALAVAQTGYAAYRAIRARFERPPNTWTVTVRRTEELYDVAAKLVSEWCPQNWRAIEARTTTDWIDVDDDRDIERSRRQYQETVTLVPGDQGTRKFELDGHPITVTAEDAVASSDSDGGVRRAAQLVFAAESEAGQRAVLSAFTAAVDRQHRRAERRPTLYLQGGFGWDRRGDVPGRPVASVAVNDNQVQDIVDDVRTFLAQEAEYVRRGIPYHRGYLLYGPPGTGKTSAVKAIAHAAGLDLYYASLGALPADTALASITSQVPPRSVLLLEDIDAFAAARERSEDAASRTGADVGVSTTGLLNVLDGVGTPHGQIVFMTTNHKEFLDPALLRPGRVDRAVLFDTPTDATVERHFTYFYGRPPGHALAANGRSGAEVNEVLISHMHDPDGAEAVLAALPKNEKEQ